MTNAFAQNEINNYEELHHLIPKWLSLESPIEQYRMGVAANTVVCQADFQLIIKNSDNSPACVKPKTFSMLIDRGWAKNTISTIEGFLEQNYHKTTYENGTMSSSYDIDVKIDPTKERDSTIYFQIFFSNGTLYHADSVPTTKLLPGGYYLYHADIRFDKYTSQERLNVNITYNNNSIVIYLPSKNNSYDIFDVKEIYPTEKGGAQWYMNTHNILDDSLFYTDPDSNASCNNPSTCLKLYKNNVDGSWYAKRIDVSENEGIRLIVKSPSNTLWMNTEMTGYYKLLNSTHYPQEFTHVTRSGSPHSSVCHGYSYYSSVTYDGNQAEVQKSLYQAGDISSYSETFASSGITTPLIDRWFGIKTMTYNIKNNTAVKFEIWIDNQDNNNWYKVFEKVDSGWTVSGNPAKIGCKNPLTGFLMNKNDIILWGGSEQQFRADNAEIDFKKLSIREIVPPIP